MSRAESGRRVPRAPLLALITALGVIVSAPTAPAFEGEIELVSRADGPNGASANDETFIGDLTPDGRFVLFGSPATNLHPDDADAFYDVFVRDRATDTTTLVSRAHGPGGATGNNHSFGFAISADGRYVAFESEATNLHPDDADTTEDVYVRDLVAGATRLVSRATGPAGLKSNGRSLFPGISADGRRVAFSSQATNLHPDDPDAEFDVFVRDLTTDTTTLASRASGAAGAKADGPANASGAPLTPDGRYVGFSSGATNLHPDDTDTATDAFVRDLATDTTLLVGRASGPDGEKSNGAVFGPSFSTDGTAMTFQAQATNLDPADTELDRDTYVRDLAGTATTLVSRATGAAGAKGNGSSVVAAGSDGGRYVAFTSESTNLDPADADPGRDLFFRDTVGDWTSLVSRASGANGAAANGAVTTEAEITADGRTVGFSSAGSNLHPDDADAFHDVFVRVAAGPPVLELAGKPKQRSARRVKLNATCSVSGCALEAAGTVKVLRKRGGRKRMDLKPAGLTLTVGEPQDLRLKAGKRVRKAIKRTMKAGKAAKAKVTATATGQFDDTSDAKQKVKLKRKRKRGG